MNGSGELQSRPAAEPASAPFPRRWWLALFVGWWTTFGLLFAVRYRYAAMRREAQVEWAEVLRLGITNAYLMALLAGMALWAAHRFPLERRRWPRSLALHAAIGIVVIGANGLLMHHVMPLVTDLPIQPLPVRYVSLFPAWSLTYALMLGIGFGVQYFHRYRDRELRASQLASQLALARLETLKMQLHPHFLFNTLNSISALMHRDVEAADRMLGRLEDLLRMTLEKVHAQEVALREELMVLEPYLEIEQARFGDRLRVVWDVDPEALEARVPHLLLQPLVENAIKHGIAPRSRPGCIALVARRAGDQLVMEVRDNGPGIAGRTLESSSAARGAPAASPNGGRQSAPRAGGGVGVSNTRARLQQLYPGRHTFELTEAMEGGAIARITIPFCRFDAPARTQERTPVPADAV